MVPFTQETIHLAHVEIHLLYFNTYNSSDYLDQLTEEEKERYFAFNHEKRRMEFVATRILRHRLFGFQHIHYDAHGAPFIQNEGFISISHAPRVVGLAISNHFKIGLDLEMVREKAVLVAHKFLSTGEMKQFDRRSAKEMSMVWSAKEVLYKLAGRKKILFNEHLLIQRTSDDLWKGTIINPKQTLRTDLQIMIKNDLIITVNPTALENGQNH
ncbi:MAG: 4'-phosphopantetheinyl transferase family protein [Flavobacteriia bacterium]|jgi:4'-phosphopantetheinyl transferase